jgi:adenine/guanine phosphoribosyltransferase-like PRPP-binding protein
LALCTSLLQSYLTSKYDAIVSCEIGGLVFASALASRVDIPLVLIREAGKLPPPTVSVTKPASHISVPKSQTKEEDGSLGSLGTLPEGKRIEMERDLLPSGAKVVVVDDVLATGETLCAVLQLLDEIGVKTEDIGVIVVAEFPVHRGRQMMRRRGFGRVNVQSLLVFGGT